MNVHNRRGGRHGHRARVILSREQGSAQYRLGLIWREEWRTAKAKAEEGALAETQSARPITGNDDASRQTKFAERIARAELGRAYWDERKERGIRARERGAQRDKRDKRRR